MTCFEIHGHSSRLLFPFGHQARNTPPSSRASPSERAQASPRISSFSATWRTLAWRMAALRARRMDFRGKGTLAGFSTVLNAKLRIGCVFWGDYIRSSTKYSQLKIFSKCEHLFRKVELFFFNTGISFSQGKFLLADCEVLAYAHEPWKLRFL
ncbi:hypothetical protein SAMN02745108_01200 [Fibrobacter intestinalis]|uniref:Uncharacterized protein n=1 Tax=Fibrobacter intestinalis TaxID=28122 RepID=A0A1T4MAC8_9BACT|nr:hypothetical protein SAMN02745108_01200 [Fibrobacter intestinalis]